MDHSIAKLTRVNRWLIDQPEDTSFCQVTVDHSIAKLTRVNRWFIDQPEGSSFSQVSSTCAGFVDVIEICCHGIDR